MGVTRQSPYRGRCTLTNATILPAINHPYPALPIPANQLPSNPHASTLSSKGAGLNHLHQIDGDVPSCLLNNRHQQDLLQRLADNKTTTSPATTTTFVHMPEPQLPPHEPQGPLNEPNQRPQPTTTPTQPRRHDDLIILHKNARSLCSDDHIDELLTELQPTTWDIIAINETWRTQT